MDFKALADALDNSKEYWEEALNTGRISYEFYQKKIAQIDERSKRKDASQ